MVVAIFKIVDGTLTLVVIDDFEGPPTDPVVTESDWTVIESDWRRDRFYLKKVKPQAAEPRDPRL